MKKYILLATLLFIFPFSVFAASAPTTAETEPVKNPSPKTRGIIDMHEHYRAGAKINVYFGIAKRLGIAKTLFVPTGNGPDNKGYKEHMAALLKLQEKYPKKIIAFCTVDSGNADAPSVFEDCLNKGGKGLKLMSGHPEFYSHPLDSDIMKQLFTIARDHDVPVLIHASIINIPTAEQEFLNLLDLFPTVRVQFAHYCSVIMTSISMEKCEMFLDRYPNLYIDLSMGGGIARYQNLMIGNDGGMQRLKDFILKYQDRIFFGSDMILAKSGGTTNRTWVFNRMVCDLSLHQEKTYKCPIVEENKDKLLPGFELTKDILKKLYIENARRFLRL